MSTVRSFPQGVFNHNDLLDRLLANQHQLGYETGYQQALRDQLEGLVPQAERFLAEAGAGQIDRKTLYTFVARIQKNLMCPKSIHGADLGPNLEGGLGI